MDAISTVMFQRKDWAGGLVILFMVNIVPTQADKEKKALFQATSQNVSSHPFLMNRLFHSIRESEYLSHIFAIVESSYILAQALSRVPLLVNTPAVRTKWTRASEMSDLLKGEMSRHERDLSAGSRSEREAYPAAVFWLMRANRQTSHFSLSKHVWILWMTYGGGNNMSPEGCEGAGRQMSPKKSVPPSLWNAGNTSPSCPVAERMAWKIRRDEYSLYMHRIYVRQRERCLGVHVLREDIGRVGGIGSPPKYPRPSYPIHLLLFKQSESTDYISHGTKNVSLQSQR